MKTQQIVIGSLVAGVAYFFLGWLIYGILLSGYMAENCNPAVSKPEDQMVWWALIGSNLVWGLLTTVVINWSKPSGMMAGAGVGAYLGVLIALGIDLSMYSMTLMYNSLNVIFVDVLCNALMFAIGGAIVAKITGGKSSET